MSIRSKLPKSAIYSLELYKDTADPYFAEPAVRFLLDTFPEDDRPRSEQVDDFMDSASIDMAYTFSVVSPTRLKEIKQGNTLQRVVDESGLAGYVVAPREPFLARILPEHLQEDVLQTVLYMQHLDSTEPSALLR